MRSFLAALVAGVASASMSAAQTSTAGAPNIATTDFDVRSALQNARMPGTNGSDPVGAFRFVCGAGQVSYDDPIVYPGKPGASHLHQFYGNTAVNYSTSFYTLRTRGGSTCNNNVDSTGRHAANRSGYWMPAMLVGNSFVLQPDYVTIYYKRLPAHDPRCNNPAATSLKAEGLCVAVPTGLKMIWGFDMLSNSLPTGHHHFACVQGSMPIANGNDLVALANAGGCPIGDRIEAMISAPECWDGRNLDSYNHRSHVSYPSYGTWGYPRCDSAHPYLMPTFTLGVFYPVTPEVHSALLALRNGAPWNYSSVLHFSSDEMRPALRPGLTFHADYFEGWDSAVKAMWTNGCINTHLNCASGNLGNGEQLKGAFSAFYDGVPSDTNPRPLIPIPMKPQGSM